MFLGFDALPPRCCSSEESALYQARIHVFVKTANEIALRWPTMVLQQPAELLSQPTCTLAPRVSVRVQSTGFIFVRTSYIIRSCLRFLTCVHQYDRKDHRCIL